MLLPAFSLKALPSRKKPLTGWLVPHLQRSLQASGEGEDAQLDKSQMRPAWRDTGLPPAHQILVHSILKALSQKLLTLLPL